MAGILKRLGYVRKGHLVSVTRDDLGVIMAGYADCMNRFFAADPDFRSRIAHRIDVPDYRDAELLRIAVSTLARQQDSFYANALSRARPHQANRLFKAATGPVEAAMLSTIIESDVRASRVFRGGLDVSGKGVDA